MALQKPTIEKWQDLIIKNGLPAQSVDLDFTPKLPGGRLASLLSAMDALSADKPKKIGTMTHFTSAYDHENAGTIALEASYFAAAHERRKVLLINATAQGYRIHTETGTYPDISLEHFTDTLARTGKTQGVPIVNIRGAGLSYATLFDNKPYQNPSFNILILKDMFEALRTVYDTIIIHSDQALQGGIAGALAPCSDGTVIIIQAERTRTPVIKEMIAMIENSGGKVIGSVMTERKYYIPQWLYGLLFKTKKRD
ncbi:MAG: hypothetical protein KDI46_04810 [Alphaproteobacteria bacterium]|nr:hypothetical protein [Alphaproteobacteria bacterium]